MVVLYIEIYTGTAGHLKNVVYPEAIRIRIQNKVPVPLLVRI